MRHLLPLLLASVIVGQAQPVPKINSLSQEWIQRGKTTDITINGEHLAEITAVYINGDPGVAANRNAPKSALTKVEASAGGIFNVTPSENGAVSIQIKAGADSSLRDREIRVATRHGVSNPLPLRFSELPEVRSTENHSMQSAQELTLPCVVNGVISAVNETDHYKFTGVPNETVLLEVIAYRLGSPLDSSLSILDPSGKEVARNEDTAGLDSVITFNPPMPGVYTVTVRDFRFTGGGDFKYRLKIGALPYVSSYFPIGGKRGDQVEVALKGANLEGVDKMKLQLAADAPTGVQELRASNHRGLSNPFLFDVNDAPNRNETEPNSSIDQADLVVFPGAVNGRIYKPKDWDAFRFKAQKGQQLTFELQAFKFGSPLDSLLTLADWRGNHLARNDDSSASDAKIDFTFPEDGEYHLLVEDLLGRGGETYTYRLTGTTPKASFAASFLPDAPRLRLGGRVPVRVEVTRLNGFSDTLKVDVENLPTGVFAEPLILTAAQPTSGILFLTAREDAALGTSPLRLRVRGIINGERMTLPAQPLSNDKPAKGAYLTILEAAPFALGSTTLMAATEQNQSATIEVQIDRRAGFNGDITVTAEGFSVGRDPITKSFDFQPITIKAGETQGSLQLRAKQDAEIGTRQIVLKAEADHGGLKVSDYSGPIPISTSEIPFVLSNSQKKLAVTAIPAGTQSAAAEAFFTVKAQRRAGFGGEIELILEGVPEGITLTASKIPANGGEATIKLVASEKAPAAKDFELKISGRGVHNDKTYRFDPGSVTLTINAPEAAEAKLAETK